MDPEPRYFKSEYKITLSSGSICYNVVLRDKLSFGLEALVGCPNATCRFYSRVLTQNS